MKTKHNGQPRQWPRLGPVIFPDRVGHPVHFSSPAFPERLIKFLLELFECFFFTLPQCKRILTKGKTDEVFSSDTQRAQPGTPAQPPQPGNLVFEGLTNNTGVQALYLDDATSTPSTAWSS